MKMDATLKMAVRAYRKVMAPVFESHEMAMYCDSQFDGGEFSGPALGEMFESEEDKMLCMVAAKFEVSANDLYEAAQTFDYIELGHEMGYYSHA